MFQRPFSFNGRIRRTEYGLSCVLYFVAVFILFAIATLFFNISDFAIQKAVIMTASLLYVPILWFMLAQSAKRCHDIGRNGWWQMVPFFSFWLLLQEGQRSANGFGNNPKNAQNAGNQIFMQ